MNKVYGLAALVRIALFAYIWLLPAVHVTMIIFFFGVKMNDFSVFMLFGHVKFLMMYPLIFLNFAMVHRNTDYVVTSTAIDFLGFLVMNLLNNNNTYSMHLFPRNNDFYSTQGNVVEFYYNFYLALVFVSIAHALHWGKKKKNL
jgi:hypothetical protein